MNGNWHALQVNEGESVGALDKRVGRQDTARHRHSLRGNKIRISAIAKERKLDERLKVLNRFTDLNEVRCKTRDEVDTTFRHGSFEHYVMDGWSGSMRTLKVEVILYR